MRIGQNVVYIDALGRKHAALITHAHDSKLVNLTFFPEEGEVPVNRATDVQYSEDDNVPNSWHYL